MQSQVIGRIDLRVIRGAQMLIHADTPTEPVRQRRSLRNDGRLDTAAPHAHAAAHQLTRR